MRKVLRTGLLFSLVISISFPCLGQGLKDIIQTEKKAFASRIGNPCTSSVLNNYDLIYVRAEWEVDPAINFIKGTVTTYFVPTVVVFNQIQFDLDTSLKVDSVKYNGTTLTFNHISTGILQAFFQNNLTINVLDSVTVYYQGAPVSGGLGSFAQGYHGSTPVAWTLSEPFGAKEWWPCKQSLNDKADSIDIIVTTPQAYRAGSNGLLLSETQSGSNKIYHWKSRYPIAAYLVAIAVTNYAVYSNFVYLPNDTLEVLNYVYPENLATAQSETPGISKIIKLFDSLTIPYPFSNEKYGHAQFNWGGGMEHQTMSFMNNFSHELMAHECAHQWFGDKITCGSWEDIWLNEGFATFFEGLTEERYYPAAWYNWKLSKINNVTSQAGGSVKCTDSTDVNRIFDGRLTYDKGGLLLHMLRWKLGDSLFFKSVKSYLNDPQLAYGYAKTPQLINHFQNASGQNLSAFFNQWYYGEGYPSYHVTWEQKGNTIDLSISQDQSHTSVPFFAMPVPIEFRGQTKDTIIVFDHTYSGQTFTTTIPFHAHLAVFDPNLQLLSAQNTVISTLDDESLGATISLYPNPSTGKVTVLNVNPANAIEEISFTDVIGRSLGTAIDAGHSREISVDVSALAVGTYFLTVKTTNGSIHKKLIRE